MIDLKVGDSMKELKERCKDIKIIVSAMDGIITEDMTAFDAMGNIIFKQYYMKDFEVINILKKTFKFAFISVDNYINYSICKNKNIPFFHAPRSKVKVLTDIIRRYDLTPENVLYVGCSYSDIEAIKLAEVTFCPSDAPESVRNSVTYSLSTYGGGGVLCELYELLKYIIKDRNLTN